MVLLFVLLLVFVLFWDFVSGFFIISILDATFNILLLLISLRKTLRTRQKIIKLSSTAFKDGSFVCVNCYLM